MSAIDLTTADNALSEAVFLSEKLSSGRRKATHEVSVTFVVSASGSVTYVVSGHYKRKSRKKAAASPPGQESLFSWPGPSENAGDSYALDHPVPGRRGSDPPDRD